MDWLRLWHDMPNDPKWRAIARRANLSIPEVMAVYMHMMVQASENDPRGSIEGWDDEDVAAALDIDVESVEAIRKAMQGKVLDGDKLRGWDKRQPNREDNSRERVRRHREKKAEESKKCNGEGNDSEAEETACNADVTQGNAPEKSREDKSKDNPPSSDDDLPSQNVTRAPKKPEPAYSEIINLYNDLLGDFLPQVVKPNDKRKRLMRARWKEVFGENSRGDDINFWRRYFLHVRRSKPLTGTKENFNWRPGFDWLLNESNMIRVIEGEFHHGDDRRSDLQEAS